MWVRAPAGRSGGISGGRSRVCAAICLFPRVMDWLCSCVLVQSQDCADHGPGDERAVADDPGRGVDGAVDEHGGQAGEAGPGDGRQGALAAPPIAAGGVGSAPGGEARAQNNPGLLSYS